MSAYVYVRSKTTFFGSSSVCNKRNKPSARYQSCTEGAMNVFGLFVNARSVRFCFGRLSTLYKDINYRCFVLRLSAKRSKTIFLVIVSVRRCFHVLLRTSEIRWYIFSQCWRKLILWTQQTADKFLVRKLELNCWNIYYDPYSAVVRETSWSLCIFQ